jgi:hypothetical protein
MSVKATIGRPTQHINVETPEGADQLARELGVESVTTIGDGARAVPLEDPTTHNQTAVAIRQPQPVGKLNLPDSGGGLEGEFEVSDLKTPQLKIVNGSGELSQKFNQGSVLFSDELIWDPPNLQPGAKNPVLFYVPLRIKKQLRENLTQDEVQEGLLPRVVNTKAEAEELSGPGCTNWINNQKPRWSPSAACLLLVQEPEHQDGVDRHAAFTTQLDGENWALAMFYAGGVAYGESARVMLSNAYTSLRDRATGRVVLHKRVWTFQVAKVKRGNFSIFVPVVRMTREETGPDAVEFINNLLGGTPTDSVE